MSFEALNTQGHLIELYGKLCSHWSNSENLYLSLPIAWFQWHSNPNHLELLPLVRIKYGKKVLNSDFKSRNCKEHYLQGVRHMKICPCLSSQILRHSHPPREISLPSLQLFFPWIGEETSFLETQILQHNKSLWFLKNIVKKKFSKYLSRLQQPVQNLLQFIPMGKGW